MTEQLYLFPGAARAVTDPGRLPDWWTPTDTEACEAYPRLMADEPAIDGPEDYDSDEYRRWETRLGYWAPWWCCRRCQHWRSPDGRAGDCRGPELNCGETDQTDTCEQWAPRAVLRALRVSVVKGAVPCRP